MAAGELPVDRKENCQTLIIDMETRQLSTAWPYVRHVHSQRRVLRNLYISFGLASALLSFLHLANNENPMRRVRFSRIVDHIKRRYGQPQCPENASATKTQSYTK